MLTLRPVPHKLAIDELLWIWQKKSNNVKDLGSHIWDAWADGEGSIGKAYGYQLGQAYDFPGGRRMDQVDNVIWQLKNAPNSRRILTNMYNFSDIMEMGLEPCAYSMSFNVTDGRLNGILNQRSQDILTANAWNVCQYAVLIHMLAQVTGLRAGEFLHVINDAHIYDRHLPLVKELIKRKSFPAPTFKINKDVKDFYDFTLDDFTFENYEAGEQIKGIEVAL
jgi:thymidylate synthase